MSMCARTGVVMLCSATSKCIPTKFSVRALKKLKNLSNRKHKHKCVLGKRCEAKGKEKQSSKQNAAETEASGRLNASNVVERNEETRTKATVKTRSNCTINMLFFSIKIHTRTISQSHICACWWQEMRKMKWERAKSTMKTNNIVLTRAHAHKTQIYINKCTYIWIWVRQPLQCIEYYMRHHAIRWRMSSSYCVEIGVCFMVQTRRNIWK